MSTGSNQEKDMTITNLHTPKRGPNNISKTDRRKKQICNVIEMSVSHIHQWTEQTEGK